MSEQQIDYRGDRDELNELLRIRREKMQFLIEQGLDPYGDKFDRTHMADDIIANFDSLEGQEAVLAGRIMSMRGHGKASFA